MNRFSTTNRPLVISLILSLFGFVLSGAWFFYYAEDRVAAFNLLNPALQQMGEQRESQVAEYKDLLADIPEQSPIELDATIERMVSILNALTFRSLVLPELYAQTEESLPQDWGEGQLPDLLESQRHAAYWRLLAELDYRMAMDNPGEGVYFLRMLREVDNAIYLDPDQAEQGLLQLTDDLVQSQADTYYRDDPLWRYLLASIYLQSDHPQLALDMVDQAVSIAPDQVLGELHYLGVLAAQELDAPTSLRQHALAAQEWLGPNDLRQAELAELLAE